MEAFLRQRRVVRETLVGMSLYESLMNWGSGYRLKECLELVSWKIQGASV